jgi:hypothetical protein
MRALGGRGIAAMVSSAAVVSLLAAIAFAASVAGQPPEEEFERPFIDAPVTGYERSDDVVVLDDESFCSHLLGMIWADRELTFRDLINRSRGQRPAKRAAFAPVSDDATLASCVSALNAFREQASSGDRVADWAREHVVIPEAFAALLPADPATDPLAAPPPPGDGARIGGFGSRTSAPFALFAGDYYIEPDTGSCSSWFATIRRLDDRSELATVSEPTNLYDVTLANYFWDVTADDCDWSIDITAVAPVPDPTPSPRPMATVPLLVERPGQFDPDDPPLTTEEAREAILEAGLVVGTCAEEFAVAVPGGYVMSQDPVAGTVVELGSAVNVVLRSGATGCAYLTAP